MNTKQIKCNFLILFLTLLMTLGGCGSNSETSCNSSSIDCDTKKPKDADQKTLNGKLGGVLN